MIRMTNKAKSNLMKKYFSPLSFVISALPMTLLACNDDSERMPSQEVTIEDMSMETERQDSEMLQMSELDQGMELDQALPPPHLVNPKAKLFLNDPITNDGELTEVLMKQTSSEYGILTSESVQVFNCLNEEGGVSGELNMGFTVEVSLCREAQTVRPDPDGNYLSYEPPSDYSDPNDQFAELMMYHHVNEVADYFKEQHEFVKYETPLPALVNVQLKTNPPLPFEGLRPGPDGFIPLDNALFFPKESWEAFAQQFGLPARDTDLIVFFQGNADFAYDASVIYHEYTHAVIGIDRLQGFVIDQYGLDSSPGGMNEGLADYFGGTILDQADVGKYGIGTITGGDGRSLDVAYQCPSDTHWEVHVHGRVIGSTMWAIREAVGQEVADRIMFNALELFNQNTSHQEASEIILVQAEAESSDIASTVRSILIEYGMLDCVRSTSWVEYNAASSRDGVPYSVSGTQAVGIPSLRTIGIPAYKQYSLDMPEEASTVGVKLSWRVAAQGSPFGGAPDLNPLILALKRGSTVELAMGPTRYIRDQAVQPALDEDDRQTIFIPSECFYAVDEDGERLSEAETIHTLFINKAAGDHFVTAMDIEWLDEVPTELIPINCYEEQEDMGGAEAGAEAGVEAGAEAGVEAEAGESTGGE